MSEKIIFKAPSKAPVGRGGHHTRGSVAQRRAMYEKFREETERVHRVLVEILEDEEADNGHRIQAGKEILNRGWGAVPQVNVIEAALSKQDGFDSDALKQMPADELKQFELSLTKLIAVREGNVTDAEIIDPDD